MINKEHRMKRKKQSGWEVKKENKGDQGCRIQSKQGSGEKDVVISSGINYNL